MVPRQPQLHRGVPQLRALIKTEKETLQTKDAVRRGEAHSTAHRPDRCNGLINGDKPNWRKISVAESPKWRIEASSNDGNLARACLKHIPPIFNYAKPLRSSPLHLAHLIDEPVLNRSFVHVEIGVFRVLNDFIPKDDLFKEK